MKTKLTGRPHTTPFRPKVAGKDKPSREDRKKVLDSIVSMCLFAGSQHSTAYRVAGEFAKGLGW